MLQKVRVTDPGDTTFLVGEDIDKKLFREQNLKKEEELQRAGKVR
jgi:DNA-directed RNA polymerase subunit beta'